MRIGDGDEVRHGPRPARPRRSRPSGRRRSSGRRSSRRVPCQKTTCPAVAPIARFVVSSSARIAAVDLAARVGVEVEELARLQRRERVGARDDRLRVQRLGMPVVRHLPRHDAAQVAVERELVDDREPPAAAVDDERAAVGLAVEPQRRGAGLVAERQLQLARASPATSVCTPGFSIRALPARVDDAERLRRADPDGRAAVGEQHAHRAGRDAAQLGAAVVVRQDPAVPQPASA